MSAARYDGLKPASARASAAARGSSRKFDTRPELLLRKELWRALCDCGADCYRGAIEASHFIPSVHFDESVERNGSWWPAGEA